MDYFLIRLLIKHTPNLFIYYIQMLGDNDLNRNAQHGGHSQRTSFINQFQDASNLQVIQLLNDKDKQIRQLKKTIKKLSNQLKQKNKIQNAMSGPETGNVKYKQLLEREMKQCEDLKQILFTVTQRIKKVSNSLGQNFQQSDKSQSMDSLIKMLENANFSPSQNSKNISSMYQGYSFQEQESDIQIEQSVDQLEIITKFFIQKNSQTMKQCKDLLLIKTQLSEQIKGLKTQLKAENKSKDLLRKLLEKNQTQKNQLMNQINTIASNKQVQSLKLRDKQQLMGHCLKLNYRIKDLEKQKEEILKSCNRDKQKEVKLYEALLNQVKGIKEKSRIRQSFG